MVMTNYRDLSTMSNDLSAGFQFEFFCEITGETWRSPFEPYRRGQLAALVSKLTWFFGNMYSASRTVGMMSEAGGRKAKQQALDEAMEMAAERFKQCPICKKWVVNAAFDDSAGHCSSCSKQFLNKAYSSGAYADESGAASALCPNCQTPSQGGRFCHECGFDMASAFKSCPGCSATMPRQARFCTDCGHSF